MILDNMKPLMDGPRSTFVELDLQLFFVTFNLFSTQISDVNLFVAEVAHQQVLAANAQMPPEFAVKKIEGLHMRRVYDTGLIQAFTELYTAKAVKRRLI